MPRGGVLNSRAMQPMKVELPKNEDVVFRQQNERMIANRDNPANSQRRYVRAGWVIAWLLVALLSLSLWLARLLGAFGVSS